MKARVLGIGRERRVTLVRRVVVARGDKDKSRRETTKRRIAVEDIAYRRLGGGSFFFLLGSLS